MPTNLKVSLFTLLLLGGCAADIEGAAAGLGEEGGVCEPNHTTPVLDWDTATIQVASADINTADGTVDIRITAEPGYELGSFYVYLGPDASSLVGYFPNPTPWVDGWETEYVLSVPYGDIGVACGEQVKVAIRGWTRDADGRIFSSAVGTYGGAGEGWYGYYDLCCAPVDAGCTLTQGYWRNHTDAWPVDSLTLGNTTYDAAALLALIRTPVRGDASLNLAHQLIAAELNAASGATPAAELAAAQTWMADNGDTLPYRVRSSRGAGPEAVGLAGALADYNEGVAGPGHCDD